MSGYAGEFTPLLDKDGKSMVKLYIRIKQFILFNYMVALVSQGNKQLYYLF
ncbi:hypothetical protein bcere0027_57330 [Bacillus cereus AH676]|nr:hypothetical protein bcere0027_57330 [Bacillus cereus AH676]